LAKIVFGAGVSHTPMLALDAKDWEFRASADLENPRLNLSDGRWVTYAELEREVGTVYADVARFEVYERKSAASQAALDRVADELEAAAPDVVIIVGDDQEELFSGANQPVVAIYHGEELTTHDSFGSESNPEWIRTVARGYAMDMCRAFPGAPQLALELITGLIQRGVDVSTLSKVVDPKVAGFGHAFGFVIQRLFRGRRIPIVPVLLNTYYPPNVPTPSRCFEIGTALRGSIEDASTGARVGIVASGGLSHFVVDETLDRRVLQGLGGDSELLVTLPRGALHAGSSESLNWILVAGAVGARPLRWSDYQPIYRTPAGTGVGVGFAVWDIADEAQIA
jgi:hypothetical protein